MNIQSLKTNKYFWLLISFIIGTFILCYRLTSSGLWYDECVEYYFSKYMTGTTPGFPEFTNMYERICFTGQPPLYNLLMWVWLRFSDSEVWFRLAGVVTALFGSMAVFSLCKEKSCCSAGLLTLIYISAFPTRYFALECGEYNLLAANLAWMLYFFYKYLEKKDRRFFVGFLVFAVLSVYSQYGAGFVVAGCGIIILHTVLFHQKNDLIMVLISGALSFVFAIVPLIYYFLIPQMDNQGSKNASHSLPISLSLLGDFLKSIKDTYSYFFLRDLSLPAKIVMLFITITLLVIVLYQCISKDSGKNFAFYYPMIWAFFISYTLYFLAVKMNFYGMVFVGGSFGNHWALSIEVFLLILTLWLLFFLSEKKRRLFYVLCILLLGVNGFSLFSTDWKKDNIREVIAENQEILKEKPIYLSYTEIIPFSYYTGGNDGNTPSFGKWTYHCENLSNDELEINITKELKKSGKNFYLFIGSEDSPATITQTLSNMGFEVDLISSPPITKKNLADMPMTSYLYHIYR